MRARGDGDPATRYLLLESMKKSSCGQKQSADESSARDVGGGLTLVTDLGLDDSASSETNRISKKLFKFYMELRNRLLRLCLDKEVWDLGHGQTMKTWKDIVTILQAIPNFEEKFAGLSWRRAKEEWEDMWEKYCNNREEVPYQNIRNGKT